jgi:sulfur-oxidizing protein SoxY
MAPLAHGAPDSEAARAARWGDLQQALFNGRPIALDAGGIVRLEVPARPSDAAQVPVEVHITSNNAAIKGLYLVIDDNPAPLAAHVIFGPAADVRDFKLPLRVDQPTNVHAVVESQDGQLHAATAFVDAKGGYSAPAGAENLAALQDVGQMKLRLPGAFEPARPLQADLSLRHPNFNGRQLSPLTHYYIPARYVRTVEITYDGQRVLRLDCDISLSTDPVVTFGFVPASKGQLRVVAKDSATLTYDQSFDVPGR